LAAHGDDRDWEEKVKRRRRQKRGNRRIIFGEKEPADIMSIDLLTGRQKKGERFGRTILAPPFERNGWGELMGATRK